MLVPFNTFMFTLITNKNNSKNMTGWRGQVIRLNAVNPSVIPYLAICARSANLHTHTDTVAAMLGAASTRGRVSKGTLTFIVH